MIPKPTPRATRWASDAMLVLAVVRGGNFEANDSCKIGALDDGSRWLALDAWGRVSGTVRKGTPRGFDEFRLLGGTRAGLYVRATDGWSPPRLMKPRVARSGGGS